MMAIGVFHPFFIVSVFLPFNRKVVKESGTAIARVKTEIARVVCHTLAANYGNRGVCHSRKRKIARGLPGLKSNPGNPMSPKTPYLSIFAIVAIVARVKIG